MSSLTPVITRRAADLLRDLVERTAAGARTDAALADKPAIAALVGRRLVEINLEHRQDGRAVRGRLGTRPDADHSLALLGDPTR